MSSLYFTIHCSFLYFSCCSIRYPYGGICCWISHQQCLWACYAPGAVIILSWPCCNATGAAMLPFSAMGVCYAPDTIVVKLVWPCCNAPADAMLPSVLWVCCAPAVAVLLLWPRYDTYIAMLPLSDVGPLLSISRIAEIVISDIYRHVESLFMSCMN